MLRSAAFLSGASTLNTDAVGSAPPDAFGPFRVLHQIGAGVLGPVFRAYEPEQGRLVAVKLFRLDLPPERVHQLVTELEALVAADLAHPGIATPVAAGFSGASAYLAQDFVTADSLDTIVRNGALPPADVARVASQLGSALAVAAALDIWHGALHPRDVLMSADDARMTGLGVTQALQVVGGTAPQRRPYTAPERLVGELWNQRADVFSLAALVYELLTGRRVPAPGDLHSDALDDVAGIDRPALRRVLSRALADDAGARFETAMAFADALQEALGRRSKPATRLASKPVKPDVEAPPAQPAFSPVPVEELPLLTDEMLGFNDSGQVPVVRRPIEPAAASSKPGELGTSGAGQSAEDRPAAVGESPADDLPLSVVDAQPAVADLHLVSNVTEPEVRVTEAEVTAEQDESLQRPGMQTFHSASSDETARPLSVVPRRRSGASITSSDSVADESPELAAAAGDRMASGVLPLLLALIVGMAIGVPIGGFFISPEWVSRRALRNPTPPVRLVEEPIREFTERAVTRDEPAPGGSNSQDQARRATTNDAKTPSRGAGQPVPPQPVAEPVVPPARAPEAASTGTVTAPANIPVPEKRPEPTRTAAVKPSAPPVKPVQKPVPAVHPQAAASASVATGGTSPAKTEPGSLDVDSRPSGASVFVDGKLVGTTPLVLSTVPLGSHAIRLERSGYTHWASSVRVAAGERSRVRASLENQ